MKCSDIDKSLVAEGWIENHFKWVVWKLAAYERRFPDQFANKYKNHINFVAQSLSGTRIEFVLIDL